ncbi:MAG: AAA family ATPase [Bdellovibrionota bacterium]
MKIVGHYHQRESLARLVKSKLTPSAFIFAGAEGIGKQLVAKALAKAMIIGDFSDIYDAKDSEISSESTLFDSGNHPDFHFAECSNKEFNIEALRDLLYRLHLKSFNAGARVIILNDANALSTQAANVLLKTLEEPRPDTHFILICSNPSLLPSTVRSRCQLWFFDRLKDSDIRHIIDANNIDSDLSIEERSKIADGSMKNLAELEKHIDEWSSIRDDLDNIFSGDNYQAHKLAERLSKDKEVLKEKLQLIRLHARDSMLNSHDPVSKNRWALLLNDIIDSQYLIFQRNFNPTYVLTSILSSLSDSQDENFNDSLKTPLSESLLR